MQAMWYKYQPTFARTVKWVNVYCLLGYTAPCYISLGRAPSVAYILYKTLTDLADSHTCARGGVNLIVVVVFVPDREPL